MPGAMIGRGGSKAPGEAFGGAADEAADKAADGGGTIHASAVALDGRGLLILGASGAGKSTLALQLIAVGAALVADDRVRLAVADGRLVASCPPALAGRIEARGVGILNAAPSGPVPLALAVDLDAAEPERLPPHRTLTLHGIVLPLVRGAGAPHLYAALRQLMLAGRHA